MGNGFSFYKETNFKETPIGKMPSSWSMVNIGKTLVLKNGKRPKIMKDGSFPVYGANGIMGYSSNFLVDNDFIIIIGRVGASGEVRLAEGKIWISDNAIYSQKYDRDKAHPPFIYYLLKFRHLAQFASKTTHPIITQSFLNVFPIYLPPLAEQRKIADVLSTIDEAIQKTDEVIAKTERLKKGLIQELLTKGIGHKEFKDTEIGKIPRGWEATKLSELSEPITKGTTPTTYGFKYTASGINFIKVESIDEHGAFIPENIPHISQEANKAFSRSILRENDILFSIAGALGRVAIVTSGILPANTNQALAIIRNKEKNRVLTEYLKYFLMGPYIQNFVKSIAIQSQQANLNLEQVRNFLVGLPSIAEQRRIAENLTAVDKKLELETNEKSRLERIKQGMMDLLLTGKIRIKAN